MFGIWVNEMVRNFIFTYAKFGVQIAALLSRLRETLRATETIGIS